VEPKRIVEILIAADGPVCVRSLVDASVHRPARSSRWVASFRDGTGRQVWRSTGLSDRRAALILAQEWEAQAKRNRAAQRALLRKPSTRVRPGSGEQHLGLLTQREVAAVLRISERAVREIERRAFDKLRRALRDFWREHETGEIREAAVPTPSAWTLSRAEAAAVYALAQTPQERQAVRKLIGLTQGVRARNPSDRCR
jgi:hypothetical protein